MHTRTIGDYSGAFRRYFTELRDGLVAQPDINVGEWQSQHGDSIIMREILHVVFEWPMPATIDSLAFETGARLPWAEDHFKERVSGEPLNPAPSEAWWPFRQKKDGDTNTDHKSEGAAFSHTYPERMWPKGVVLNDFCGSTTAHGLRFDLGDLGDVAQQLTDSPMTRQAYLPIWFPEDTGAVHGKRVPCTLGYHFIIRNNRLDVSYFMRSTDLLRHFQDDVYLAVRLAQWMAERVSELWEEQDITLNGRLRVGNLIFHTANMHIFAQDEHMINFWKTQGKVWF